MSTGRFYKAATVVTSGDGWAIDLDGRSVRTPAGDDQIIPSHALATGMAEEWNNQGDKVLPESMPLSGLTNAAIDKVVTQRKTFINQIEEFSRTDPVCYWSEEPPSLIKRQHTVWQPLLDWVKSRFNADYVSTPELEHIAQSEQTIGIIRAHVETLDAFELAAYTDLTTTLGSVIISLALFHNHLDMEQAFKAAYLEELFQIEKWGEDFEAMERHKNLKNDLTDTVKFLELLRAK